jgi:two-component system chemotaxis response regulator CheB
VSLALNPAPSATSEEPVRVMIVDDSAVVRGLVTRWLQQDPAFELVASAADGAQALNKLDQAKPEVCILDVEMPVMGGLEALPEMLRRRPDLKVIMASTLTTRGGRVTLQALHLGAADYVSKPEASRLGGADAYRAELLEKTRQLALAARRRRRFVAAPAARAAPAPAFPAPAPGLRLDVVAIASSTGGPPALSKLLAGLPADWRAPILIVQHMPAGFTSLLAEHLGRICPIPVREAKDGEIVEPRTVYVAPGDQHMVVRRDGVRPSVALNRDPPENWCRPAADPLFRSVAEVYGDRAVGLVLTGMGHDGREGARALRARGGRLIAQDEATSVVWGMPGAVVEAGLATDVRPLEAVAQTLAEFARGGARP